MLSRRKEEDTLVCGPGIRLWMLHHTDLYHGEGKLEAMLRMAAGLVQRRVVGPAQQLEGPRIDSTWTPG